jgi:hypothetical protein
MKPENSSLSWSRNLGRFIRTEEFTRWWMKVPWQVSRPPGHHAYSDLMSGMCFLNNAAIAAHQLTKRFDRVAIVDIDVHHGNGTQSIFWE